ncbi:hypothetical protein [Kribbella sp. NPDC004875]|uniref:hypothetical protein n=1 Tax=Kribbella sp. NPDC004875 TaxID=3364107 RepID=UPI0036A42948
MLIESAQASEPNDVGDKVAAVKRIVDNWHMSPEQRLREIRAVLYPRVERQPVPTIDRGWPLLRPSKYVPETRS